MDSFAHRGHRPLREVTVLVGRYIYHRLTPEGREGLRKAMRRADGRDESDGLYCDLGNNGLSVTACAGVPVTAQHMIRLLDDIADLRLRAYSRSDYTGMLTEISEGTGVRTYVALFEDATGIPDEDVFDEFYDPHDESEFTVKWVLDDLFDRQWEELKRSRYPRIPEYRQAHPRPGLHHYAPEDPIFDEPRQLMLPNMKHLWLGKPRR
jgi:hypothetical protein